MIEDPEQIDKWIRWLGNKWKKPGWRLSIVIVVLMGLLWGVLPTYFLKKRAEGAEITIQTQRDDLAASRHQNDNLVASNLYYQTLLEPIRRTYPDLDLAAAAAQMKRDIDLLHVESRREVFTPFSDKMKLGFVNSFTLFHQRWPTVTNIYFQVEDGNKNRFLIGSEIVECAKQANVFVTLGKGLMIGSSPLSNWSIHYPTNGLETANDLVKVLGVVLNDRPAGRERPLPRSGSLRPLADTFLISLYGTPLFATNGTVTFK